MATKLFIGNLDVAVSEKDLHDAFALHATLSEIRVVRDETTGRSRGYGFVTFPSGSEAMKVIAAFNCRPFKGHRMIINEALPNEEWFSGPMKDLGLTDEQWAIVEGYEKLLTARRLCPGDGVRLQALLYYAVYFGSAAHMERVLAAGANPNMVLARSETPLGKVIETAHPIDTKEHRIEMVELLLKAGADPNLPSEGRTPLVIAGKVDIDIVRMLRAASVRTSPAELNMVLLDAAAKGDARMVKELLASGASANHRGKFQSALGPDTSVTALMLAAFGAHLRSLQALLEAGAEVNLKDGAGHTALDYAAFDPERCRKVIPLLEKAGGISGLPFPHDEHDEATRDFAAAARTPAFKQAIARMKQLTGTKPRPLHNAEDKIPGGYGFLWEENSSKTFVERGPAEYLAVGDRARQFVEEHQSEMRELGAYLFYTRDLTDINGRAVALLPTVDIFRVVAAVGTEGANSDVYNEDLIAWLVELEKDQPFVVTGLGADFLDARFVTPVEDPEALRRRINAICPDDEDPGPDVERRQIEHLRETNRLYLWWD